MKALLKIVLDDTGRWCDVLYDRVTEVEIDAVRNQNFVLGSEAGLEILTERNIRMVASWLKEADHAPEDLGFVLGRVQQILERNSGKRLVQQEFGAVRDALLPKVNRVVAALATVA